MARRANVVVPRPEPTAEDIDRLAAVEGKRVFAVRMQLAEEHPFWGYLLLEMKMIQSPELPAMAATDCVGSIWYNPRMTCCLTLRQLGFVLVHEIGHHVLQTLDRERGRDRHLWNCATDYAINRIVAEIPNPAGRWDQPAMYDPPNGHIPGLGHVEILLDRRFDGKIAEVIYDELDEAGEDGEGPGGDAVAGQGGEGGKTGAGARSNKAGQAGGGKSDTGNQGGEPGKRGTVDVPLGEGVVLPGVQDHGGGIDVHLPDLRTPEQREAAIDRIRAAVEHWKNSDMRGNMPGEVQRNFVDASSRVPWQRVFRSFLSQARSRDEYDPRRPNRKWLEAGTIVPSRGGETMGTVVVALDTSGSMSVKDISEFVAEIRAISREVEELFLVVADAEIQETFEMDQVDAWLRAGCAKGGGGTSHIPVFEWVEKQRVEPEVFIGLSDLASIFPARPPRYPVIWVAPAKHGKVPFGKLVEFPAPPLPPWRRRRP